MMVSQTIGAGVFLLWSRMAHPDRSIPLDSIGSNGPLLTFAFLVSTPFVLGYFFLAVKLTGVPLTEYLALKWPRWLDIVIGIAALAAVLLLAGLAASASGQETPEFMTETFASARAAGMLPLFAFSFVVLPPLQEEILFRGFQPTHARHHSIQSNVSRPPRCRASPLRRCRRLTSNHRWRSCPWNPAQRSTCR